MNYTFCIAGGVGVSVLLFTFYIGLFSIETEYQVETEYQTPRINAYVAGATPPHIETWEMF